jgi:hypothetical protein
MSGQISDYRIYIVSVPGQSYPHNEIRVWATVYKSRKAIANKVNFPGPAKVRHEISMRCPWVRNFGEVTLYWTGQIFIEKSEYDIKLANIQKRWLKNQAERDRKAKEQTEKDAAKATVDDVLQFLRESRRNSVNSNVNANTKAGLTTSESRGLTDRCDREGAK